MHCGVRGGEGGGKRSRNFYTNHGMYPKHRRFHTGDENVWRPSSIDVFRSKGEIRAGFAVVRPRHVRGEGCPRLGKARLLPPWF